MARELNLEHTYCNNQTCPKKDKCGNHIARIQGAHWVCWQSIFEPDKDGHCGFEEPYEELVVPEWLQKLADTWGEEAKKKHKETSNER